MTTQTESDPTELAVLDELASARTALSADRVFGTMHVAEGVALLPVARLAGGAGGGGGAGTDAEDREGHGFGSGFGVGARPLGVYEIREAHARWRPAIDVDRLLRGAEALIGLAIVATAFVALRRRP